MSSYKLTYFNGAGRAEISRLIFAAAGVEFNDERLTNWPVGKEDTPLGQLPYLTVEGVKIPQSISIARFLANRFNLAGKNDLEKVKADAIVDTTSDMINAYVAKVFIVPEAERPEAIKKFLAEDAGKHLANVEKLIKSYGSDGHAVGDSLTWADLQIFELGNMMGRYDPNITNSYPEISKVRKTVEEHPKIAAYLKTKPVTHF